MKDHMVCVIYVDDTIFAGPNQKYIGREIIILVFNQDNEEQPPNLEMKAKYQLSLELKMNKNIKMNFIYHNLVSLLKYSMQQEW